MYLWGRALLLLNNSIFEHFSSYPSAHVQWLRDFQMEYPLVKVQLDPYLVNLELGCWLSHGFVKVWFLERWIKYGAELCHESCKWLVSIGKHLLLFGLMITGVPERDYEWENLERVTRATIVQIDLNALDCLVRSLLIPDLMTRCLDWFGYLRWCALERNCGMYGTLWR